MTNLDAHQLTEPVFARIALDWPTRINPWAHEYRHRAARALRDLGVISADSGDPNTRAFGGIVVLDAYVYPYSQLERLLAAGTFSQWLFFLDDAYDNHPTVGRSLECARALMTSAYELLSTGQSAADLSPFERLTLYLRRQLEELGPRGWMPRFLGHVRDYLFRGSLAAVAHWSNGTVPATLEYLELRMHDSAVFPALDMVEIAASIDLPEDVLRHPTLLEMGRATVRHTAYVNDLFSYQKEVLWSGTPCNLVHVLMHNEKLDFRQAVDLVIDMVNADAVRFGELETSRPRWRADIERAVESYITGMKAWMRGNIDFSLASLRYRAPDSPFVELRAPAVALDTAVMD